MLRCHTLCLQYEFQTMTINSLIIQLSWGECSGLKCQTRYLSDWLIVSPCYHRRAQHQTDSPIRCHVKHVTLDSQYLIPVTICHYFVQTGLCLYTQSSIISKFLSLMFFFWFGENILICSQVIGFEILVLSMLGTALAV